MSPARRSRGTGGLYKRSKDGLWIGSVDLGYGPDGKRRRKVVSAPTRAQAARKLALLRREVDAHGDVSTSAVTVEKWFTTWLDEIAPGRVAPRTLDTYRGYVTRYILPALGKRRLDRVQPQHIRAVHTAITGAGLSTTTARQAHAIIGRAFADARREGLTALDVADRMEPPRIAGADITALDADQAITLLRATQKEPLGARWPSRRASENALTTMACACRVVVGDRCAMEACSARMCCGVTRSSRRLPSAGTM